MTKEISSIPVDVLRVSEDEIARGADPEILAGLGYHIPGTTELRFEDEAKVMEEGKAGLSDDRVADPELDAEWQERRTLAVGRDVGAVATTSLTSRQKNSNARRAETAHIKRSQSWRQTRRR